MKSARTMYDLEEQKRLKASNEGFNMAAPGTRVFQHLNLSARGRAEKWFSIHDRPTSGGLLVGRCKGVVQSNVTFVVGEGGYRSVSVKKQDKSVFAGAVGALSAVSGAGDGDFGSVPTRDQVWIRYNPRKRDEGLIARWFCRQNPETGEWDIPVIKARRTVAFGHKLYGSGVTDMPREAYEPLLKELGLGAYREASIRLARQGDPNGPFVLRIHEAGQEAALRCKLIRLAYESPNLRSQILPLLKGE